MLNVYTNQISLSRQELKNASVLVKLFYAAILSILFYNDYNICFCRSQTEKLASIRNSCRAFFMELVSTLCFGTHLAPEPPLIQMLINTVFTERQETEVRTREFSPYHEAKSDEVPVIRSFLLKLLLEHK